MRRSQSWNFRVVMRETNSLLLPKSLSRVCVCVLRECCGSAQKRAESLHEGPWLCPPLLVLAEKNALNLELPGPCTLLKLSHFPSLSQPSNSNKRAK